MTWLRLKDGRLVNLERVAQLAVTPHWEPDKAKAGEYQVRYWPTFEGPSLQGGDFPTKAMADAFVAGLGLSIKGHA